MLREKARSRLAVLLAVETERKTEEERRGDFFGGGRLKKILIVCLSRFSFFRAVDYSVPAGFL